MSFRTYNPSLSHSMFMTCCFSCSCFSLFPGFISYSGFMPIPCGISDTYTYTGILTYSHIIHVFLFLSESTLFRNWNHSNRIIQTKVMAFSCQLVGLPILPRDSLQYSFSSALSSYLTLVLCTPLKLRY